jgi:hypothetical protein
LNRGFVTERCARAVNRRRDKIKNHLPRGDSGISSKPPDPPPAARVGGAVPVRAPVRIPSAPPVRLTFPQARTIENHHTFGNMVTTVVRPGCE